MIALPDTDSTPNATSPTSRPQTLDTTLATIILITLTLVYILQCITFHQTRRTRIETRRLLQIARRLETLYGLRPWAPAAGDEATRAETLYIPVPQDVQAEEGGDGVHEVDVAPPPYVDEDDAGPAASGLAFPEGEELLGSRAEDGADGEELLGSRAEDGE